MRAYAEQRVDGPVIAVAMTSRRLGTLDMQARADEQGGSAMQSNIQIGYMNIHHQRALARARARGDKNLSFVMWCSKCARSYVVGKDEVSQCRCPLHDHGAPALVADTAAVEWLR
jgi:hypothetical protein